MAGDAVVILQARLGSTRLPGKVLADVAGRPLVVHAVRRLQAAQVGPVVVATTTLPADDVVAETAAAAGAHVVRGPSADVLERFRQAASLWPCPFVLRATADNPAVDIEAPGRVLQCLRDGADYVVESGLPVGAAVEGVRASVLAVAADEAYEAGDREHVTPFIRQRPQRFRVVMPEAPARIRRPDLRFTVDTPDDLAWMRRVIAASGQGDGDVALVRLIEVADGLSAETEAP